MTGKTAVVTGGSRGLGRAIATALDRAGVKVTVVARDEARLAQVRTETEGRVATRAGDATDQAFADSVMREVRPDILVLFAGARPPKAPIHEHTWESFSAPWNSDVKSTFYWTQAAMKLPLAPGSTVLIARSGAGMGGSPLSGGYAGAKRTQWIMADYLQRESNAAKLGIHFHAVIPRSIIADSEMGSAAVDSYAELAGVTREKYLERFGKVVTTAGVARGVLAILEAPPVDAAAYVVLEDRVLPVGVGFSMAEFGALK